jgi:putative hydrolase of the HAD superfamily
MHPTIRVIFFDAAGTLIHLPRGVGYHYRIVAEKHGCHVAESEWTAAFRAVWSLMPIPQTSGAPREDDDKGWWRALVGRVVDRCLPHGKPFDRDAYFEELYAHFALPGVWGLYPDAEVALQKLGGEFRLAVLSNFDSRLRVILSHLGITGLFEKLIISSEVGADKPHEPIFRHALSAMGVNPDEAVHVGDDPDADWQGASRVGIRCYELDRSRNSLEDLPQFLRSLTA